MILTILLFYPLKKSNFNPESIKMKSHGANIKNVLNLKFLLLELVKEIYLINGFKKISWKKSQI